MAHKKNEHFIEESDDKEDHFPKTVWQLVRDVHDPATVIRTDALGKMYKAYAKPLYGYARGRGNDEQKSEELVQAYFQKLVANANLQGADESKGKFRHYLRAGFDNFIKNEYKKENAQKRGGQVKFVPIDITEAERYVKYSSAANASPENLYERIWARTLLENSMRRLRSRYKREGKLDRFKALLPYLTGDLDSAELAKKIGCKVESAPVYKQRFKKDYQDCIRAEITDTIEPGGDVEEELMNLLTAFS